MRVLKFVLKHSTVAVAMPVVVMLAASSCAFKHKKYENPILNGSQQPDKVLFDSAIHDIEKGRYEIARITLNTLLNTYDSSEYAAKAKLAVADSWYREGGMKGLAQAEIEYKDFILFYPTMAEAAESQSKICKIHYQEMEKPDRDPNEALKAEQECRQVLIQFPNSKFAPETEQLLRNVQEVLATGEFGVGDFYHNKGAFASAANRLSGVVDQYPLFSRADEALWLAGDSYAKMGPRFRNLEGDAYTRLVRDYPLSAYAEQAKAKLKDLEMPVPDADPAAVARMRYEQDNKTTPGVFHRATGFMRRGPETASAAKSGTPQMNSPKQNIPVIVPVPGSTGGFQGDLTVAPVASSSAPDTSPDARQTPPASPKQ
jgi:outer membrane protein assembly factor BamD